MDSSSSEEEDFEGFVVTPEEKLSYKAWTRKRRASEAFNDSSDDDLSGDDDNEEDDDDEEDNQQENDDDDDDDDDDEDDDDDQGIFMLQFFSFSKSVIFHDVLRNPSGNYVILFSVRTTF